MEVRAYYRHLKQSPTKVRLIVNAIRGLSVAEAEERLRFMSRRATLPVAKLLASAIANAEHNFKADRTLLFIKDIQANEGPKLKRWTPKAYGSAGKIIKRSSHVSIVLTDTPVVKKAKKTYNPANKRVKAKTTSTK